MFEEKFKFDLMTTVAFTANIGNNIFGYSIKRYKVNLTVF